MNRRNVLAAAALAAALPLPSVALAHGYTLGALEIGHPWARATPPGAPTGAAYLSIENTGEEPDRLVAASFAGAAKTEIHEMTMQDGVMRMAELVNGLDLPPRTKVTLKPGGYHIMFIGLKERLLEGDRVPMTLTFEKAGSIEVELAVEGAGEDEGGHGHEHEAS